MSLQGSLDTFALPDVLVLLASTKKSGELHVAGNRGPGGARTGDLQGLVWIENGQLVGYDVAKATDAPTALFELLRLAEGSFSFVSGSAPSPQEPIEIEPVLAEAQAYLAEWREIEKVVPSLSAWLNLAPEAPAAHVSMRAEQWHLIVSVGGGCDVASVVERLGHGELGGCRAVKELAEAGLLEVGARGAEPALPEPAPTFSSREADEPPAVDDQPGDEPAAVFEPTSVFRDLVQDDPQDDARDGDLALLDTAEHDPAHAVADADDLVTLPARSKKARGTSAEEPESLDSYAEPRRRTKAVLGTAQPERDPASQALTRQLASLGDEPADAEALASPAGAEGTLIDPQTGEELDGDEPLNRGLLLKFLSSVRN